MQRQESEPTPPRRVRFPDAQLVALARARTPGIEEHLHARLAPVVNRVVWSLLGPDSEHDDVIHDVFLRILRGIVDLREADRLEQWAARVTVNTVRNELRRRRLRRWVFWNAFEDPGPLRYAPDMEGRELVARAYSALEKLPDEERVVLSLRLFHHRTLEEVAASAGCSASTAKRRLRRARERFTRIAERDELLSRWLERTEPQGSDEDG